MNEEEMMINILAGGQDYCWDVIECIPNPIGRAKIRGLFFHTLKELNLECKIKVLNLNKFQQFIKNLTTTI
jgi:hypothetical protein